MPRWLPALYGLACYGAFVVAFVALLAFIGGLTDPSLGDTAPFSWGAVAWDTALIALFAAQHSVMARRGFKRVARRRIPEALERSTYVLASSAAVGAMVLGWRPAGGVVWVADEAWAQAALVAVAAYGLALTLVAGTSIDHLGLFGLRQSVGTVARAGPGLVWSGVYARIRHPLLLGFLLMAWSWPSMTAGRLVFALAFSGYIALGVALEERDLVLAHPEYREYRRRVPMFVPRPWRRAGRYAPLRSERTS
ncbi:MAG: isoprenylcysteine carboxylmethyltransferase family protein [Acidobacteria bacterium]|nr:isoprenylcysteine carboxylmethyltransferase family protein [Acidobacteriota bacterium]